MKPIHFLIAAACALLAATAAAQTSGNVPRAVPAATVSNITGTGPVVVNASGTVFDIGLQPCAPGQSLVWQATPAPAGYKCTTPAAGTPFVLLNTSTDAGANKGNAIARSGSIMIGGTVPPSPQALLQLQMTASTTPAISNIAQYGQNGQLKLYNIGGNSSKVAITYDGQGGNGAAIEFGRGANAWETYQAFYTAPASTAASGFVAERMRIDPNGSVGIGTPTPVAKLTLQGNPADRVLGPNFESRLNSIHPNYQLLNWTNDNVSTSYDGYFNGGQWTHAGTTGAFNLYKQGGRFNLNYALPSTVGAALGWTSAFSVGMNGQVRLDRYNAPNTYTGTPISSLAVDAVGNVIQTPVVANPPWVRAQANLSGGGAKTWINSNFDWTGRFIAMNLGSGAGSQYAASYYDIAKPPVGTVVTGICSASSATVTAAGVPMTQPWLALYYKLPFTGGNGSLPGNFFLAYYGTCVIPDDFVMLAMRNDDGQFGAVQPLKLGTGERIAEPVQYRADAGLQGNAGALSGFYQTDAPAPAANWYPGANSWNHLLDIRHVNQSNNYAMQVAGNFFDQDFWVRKTNGNPSTAWSKLITTDQTNQMLQLPRGTIAQRPACNSTSQGAMRHNTTTNRPEFCSGTAWVSL